MAIPIVSQQGLKVLDEYFAWQRTSEATAATAVALGEVTP
jgi:hypothetical protein